MDMQRARCTPEPEEPRPQALARNREAAKSDPDDPGLDFVEVPAAVVCASCGKPDCAGCLDVAETTNASGVVAIIPWERPGLGWLTRLGATARRNNIARHSACFPQPDRRPWPHVGPRGAGRLNRSQKTQRITEASVLLS